MGEVLCGIPFKFNSKNPNIVQTSLWTFGPVVLEISMRLEGTHQGSDSL